MVIIKAYALLLSGVLPLDIRKLSKSSLHWLQCFSHVFLRENCNHLGCHLMSICLNPHWRWFSSCCFPGGTEQCPVNMLSLWHWHMATFVVAGGCFGWSTQILKYILWVAVPKNSSQVWWWIPPTLKFASCTSAVGSPWHLPRRLVTPNWHPNYFFFSFMVDFAWVGGWPLQNNQWASTTCPGAW